MSPASRTYVNDIGSRVAFSRTCALCARARARARCVRTQVARISDTWLNIAYALPMYNISKSRTCVRVHARTRGRGCEPISMREVRHGFNLRKLRRLEPSQPISLREVPEANFWGNPRNLVGKGRSFGALGMAAGRARRGVGARGSVLVWVGAALASSRSCGRFGGAMRSPARQARLRPCDPPPGAVLRRPCDRTAEGTPCRDSQAHGRGCSGR